MTWCVGIHWLPCKFGTTTWKNPQSCKHFVPPKPFSHLQNSPYLPPVLLGGMSWPLLLSLLTFSPLLACRGGYQVGAGPELYLYLLINNSLSHLPFDTVYITGFMELRPGAIKDAEGVGQCSQVCYPQLLRRYYTTDVYSVSICTVLWALLLIIIMLLL